MNLRLTLAVVLTAISFHGCRASGSAFSTSYPAETLKRFCAFFTGPKTEAEMMDNPSEVSLAGVPMQTQVLCRTEWFLLNSPASGDISRKMEDSAMKLPREQRLKVARPAEERFPFWWAPMAVGADPVKIKLALAQTPQTALQLHREAVYLGHDGRWAWFTHMPLRYWVRLQRELKLTGGDDPIAAAVQGLSALDEPDEMGRRFATTQYDSVYILVDGGSAGIAAIKKLIADGSPCTDAFIKEMGQANDREQTKFLIEYATSADARLAPMARRRLTVPPRQEAADFYLKWLQEGAGKTPVFHELRACRETHVKIPAQAFAKIIARPTSESEYRLAIEMSRSQEGRPIPAKIIEAEKTLYDHGASQAETLQAIHELAVSDDPQLAGAIALELALRTGDRKAPFEGENPGMIVLRRLPNGEGKRVVLLLEKYCVKGYSDPARVKSLADKFRGSN